MRYVSRRVRLRRGALGGDKLVGIGARPGCPRGLWLIAQEDHWILTAFGYGAGHHPPTGEGGYLEFLATVAPPEVLGAIRESEPLGDLVSHRFPASRRRRYERLMRFPEGLLVAGDALSSVNPLYGQGMSVAALEALALRQALERGEPRLAQHFFGAAGKVVGQAWDLAVGSDLGLPEVEGHRSLELRLTNAYMERLLGVAEHDPFVAGRVQRRGRPPGAALARAAPPDPLAGPPAAPGARRRRPPPCAARRRTGWPPGSPRRARDQEPQRGCAPDATDDRASVGRPPRPRPPARPRLQRLPCSGQARRRRGTRRAGAAPSGEGGMSGGRSGALRVVVVGGGIGGLTAALALRQAGLDAHVYEQAAVLREVGAGLALGPNAVKVLHRLGLAGRSAPSSSSRSRSTGATGGTATSLAGCRSPTRPWPAGGRRSTTCTGRISTTSSGPRSASSTSRSGHGACRSSSKAPR